jgi:hypothetical protein
MSLDGYRSILFVGYFDLGLVGIGIQNTFYCQTGIRFCGAYQTNDYRNAYKQFPPPVLADKRKNRCSILFHLLVPGGKCSTVISLFIFI